MTLRSIFITNLKRIRKQKHISQMQLAEKYNTSTSYIGEIEIGKKFPSVEMISNISEALEIRPFELFMEESDYFVPTINPNLKKTLIQKISQVIEDTL